MNRYQLHHYTPRLNTRLLFSLITIKIFKGYLTLNEYPVMVHGSNSVLPHVPRVSQSSLISVGGLERTKPRLDEPRNSLMTVSGHSQLITRNRTIEREMAQLLKIQPQSSLENHQQPTNSIDQLGLCHRSQSQARSLTSQSPPPKIASLISPLCRQMHAIQCKAAIVMCIIQAAQG